MSNAPSTSGNLVVVEKLAKFADDRSEMKITIESRNNNFPAAIEELGSAAARNLAISYAASVGVPDPRINGFGSAPYAINAEGLSHDELKDAQGNLLPMNHPRCQPAAYRVDIPICRKMA